MLALVDEQNYGIQAAENPTKVQHNIYRAAPDLQLLVFELQVPCALYFVHAEGRVRESGEFAAKKRLLRLFRNRAANRSVSEEQLPDLVLIQNEFYFTYVNMLLDAQLALSLSARDRSGNGASEIETEARAEVLSLFARIAQNGAELQQTEFENILVRFFVQIRYNLFSLDYN